ncbi:MAG: hypothetical protein RL211_80 [Pseudomonadota bacterium]
MPQLIVSVEGVRIQHAYLHKNRTTLGRKLHNDIVLENMAVSGEHCAFELHGLMDVYVEDLRSTNGTYLNGKMIVRQRLADQDVIAIGKFRIQYLCSSEPSDSGGITSTMKLDVINPVADSSLRHASFQVLSGSSAGLEVPVVKAVTTFGKPGVAVVAVSHRRNGYYVAHMDGTARTTLNGRPIGTDAVALADHDVLDLAGTRMQFLLKE